ncbi:MAG: matrixin family metalloprotease [Proteobacteria bacterium]|nr:matrixin family metalloprotease [Pseudomonadota bacterium]
MKKILIYLTFIIAGGPRAWAGNSTGGGDNFRFADEAAWFNDSQKSIFGCVESSPTFGVSLEVARTEIEHAFATWRHYIEAKRVFKQYPAAVRFATNFRFIEHCDGSEDIKFYLGASNDQVTTAKAKYHNPTAFVERTSFDEKSKWRKGFVWIASTKSLDIGFGTGQFPNWDQKNNLLAILLHEIGHVYGIDHVAGTIMTSEISDVLSWSDQWQSTKAKIDHTRELYRCKSCAFDLSTTISIDDKASGWKMMKSLIGRAPDDFSKIRMVRAENSPIVSVEVSDGSGANVLKVIITSEILVNNDARVFRSPLGISHENYSSVSNATTLEISGKRLAMTLEYNMGSTNGNGSAPLVLTVLDEVRRIELARFSELIPDSLP